MKKITVLLCSLLSFSIYCNAQITWEKLFVQSNTDVFRSVQEVPAGGYIAAGYTSHWSDNDTDAFVVRLTVNGDTIWTRSFNGGKKDLFYKVINTSDGGFVMCGYSSSYGAGSDDAYYMKLDANGNELWHFIYGGTGKERAQEIIQTSDGGYAMCGYTNTGTGAQGFNSFLVKIDANGGQTWNMKYGGTGYDDANSVKEILPGGDFIMAGQTTSSGFGAGDIWLVRANSLGVQQWTQNIGTPSNDNAEHLQLATAGGFIICGSTQGLGVGSDDGYLVKTDDLGAVQWYKTYGGSSPDDFHRVENTTDGGYIVTGTSQSNALIISNQWLVKTNVNGDSTWAYTFGGANHDHAYSGMQTSDGGYIFCGYSASFGFNYEDALVIKVDGNGLLYNHLIYTTVTTLVTPQNNTCGSANSVVTITVRNFGDTALSTFPDTVVITGAITQTLGQTFTGTISPPNFTNHTFTTTINTSTGGVFHFHCFTSNNNDVYPAMNSSDSTITILGLPTPPTAVNDTNCGPGSLTLTASSPYTMNWFTSPTGGTSLTTGNSYTTPVISNTTTYYVQATNACGTSSRTPVTAVILPVSAAPLGFGAQRCGPGTVTLLASASDTLSWWGNSTGGTVLLFNSNTYIPFVSSTDTFYVQAGTTCPSNRVPVIATVNFLPDAIFTPNASAVCLGDAFLFTNASTGASGYSWDFGDATGTSSQMSPSYTYGQIGSYVVRLIAVSSQSCNDTTTVTVNVNTAPQVSFTSTPTSGCVPFTATFTNTTTNAANYLWNFGDGTTSTDAAPIHDYLTAGTFTVTLLATVGSCADSDSVVGMITTFTPPIFDLGPDISTNSVTYLLDAGAGFSSYQWSNGSTTQSIIADTSGIYCAIVTDNNTCSDSDCVQIILDALSAGNISDENDFTIYPNPADESAVISWQSANGKSVELNVFESTGRLITKQDLFATCTLPIASWQAGVYFVEIQAGDKTIRKKLIVY